ncbi:hypothetical protein B0H63DRAFT_510987 [Podospora didyma]|uniref:Uncharacterized protein n=1 Tax=Podospora didyma TaxID=330526 RepID=A0AAE0NGH8_9PEZI|nr:hypothetical protein B0H63DRAFT_510987 [Podospora didyma]
MYFALHCRNDPYSSQLSSPKMMAIPNSTPLLERFREIDRAAASIKANGDRTVGRLTFAWLWREGKAPDAAPCFFTAGELKRYCGGLVKADDNGFLQFTKDPDIMYDYLVSDELPQREEYFHLTDELFFQDIFDPVMKFACGVADTIRRNPKKKGVADYRLDLLWHICSDIAFVMVRFYGGSRLESKLAGKDKVWDHWASVFDLAVVKEFQRNSNWFKKHPRWKTFNHEHLHGQVTPEERREGTSVRRSMHSMGLLLLNQRWELAKQYLETKGADALLAWQATEVLATDFGRSLLGGVDCGILSVLKLVEMAGQQTKDATHLLLQCIELHFWETVGCCQPIDVESHSAGTRLSWKILSPLIADKRSNLDGGEYLLTPLQLAASCQDVRAARLLLQAGAKPNVRGKALGKVPALVVDAKWGDMKFDSVTPLHVALNSSAAARAGSSAESTEDSSAGCTVVKARGQQSQLVLMQRSFRGQEAVAVIKEMLGQKGGKDMS